MATEETKEIANVDEEVAALIAKTPKFVQLKMRELL